MNTRPFLLLLLLVLLTSLTIGCRETVPAGHIGHKWEPGGFEGEILKPGKHNCWGFCEMYLMEATDQAFDIPMSVLCADNLNFSFTINTLVGVNLGNNKAVKSAFENLKPAGDHLFTVQQLFATYIMPVADQEARKVVSKYMTPELVQKRAQVIEEVRAAVAAATTTAILQVKRTTVGNLDFPDVITQAQEARAKKNVEIDTARAEGLRQAAEAEAKIKLARIQAQEKLLRAQSQADSNRILAASVSPQLIMWRQWDVMEEAANGDNNLFLIPYTDAANDGLDASKWLKPQGILDAELLERIKEAKEASVARAEAKDKKGAEDVKAEPPTPAAP